jgi:hypothetical protein
MVFGAGLINFPAFLNLLYNFEGRLLLSSVQLLRPSLLADHRCALLSYGVAFLVECSKKKLLLRSEIRKIGSGGAPEECLPWL